MTAAKPFFVIISKILFQIRHFSYFRNKQIFVYFEMGIYLVSGEHTLDIKFVIVKPAFIIQFRRFALSVSEDLIKRQKCQ